MNAAARWFSVALHPSLYWLLALAIACILAVLGLDVAFERLRDDLGARSRNETARLSIGDEIVREIGGIEKSLYGMVAITSGVGLQRARREIDDMLAKLRHDIGVLKQGGRVERVLQLNLGEAENMVHVIEYRRPAGDQPFILEEIEMTPLLDQVDDKAAAFEALILQRQECVANADQACLIHVQPRILLFVKQLQPFFVRLNENANRLFYDSYQRLNELQEQLDERRLWLGRLKQALLGLVIFCAVLFAVLFVRRLQQANAQLGQAIDAMRAAKDEAERASRAKTEFVSRMSHELRTPLNAIIGFGELLESEPLGESQRKYVELINGSGKHLMELINAVLDHAKIEAGELTLEAVVYDLEGLVGSVGSMIGARANAKGLEFEVHVAEGLPRRVVGDPTRLKQILLNLLGNAVKFTERGKIELRTGREAGRLVFGVRDTGVGMDAATLKKLFQPFSQADESVSRKYGGTGLGLLIARELIEAMGGSIEVESAPGNGSAFRFWLPLREAGAAAAADEGATDSIVAQDLAERVGGRILLVDDNGVNRQLAGAMLERLGLRCESATNGEEALRRLAEGEYALVLMDVEMPVMDGITATRRLRAAETAQGRRLPVIALTANALNEDREKCLAAGMDGYLAKPIGLANLRNELLRVLGGEAVAVAAPPPVAAGELFDRAAAVERMGDEDLFDELAQMFVARAAGHLTEIDRSLAAGEAAELARAAHTLKGLCATFAAAPSEAAALQLEQAAKRGDLAACPALAAAVRIQTEALTAALAA